MEEVEALSDKLGIMVKGGVFRCYGSCQHIKDKFGTGYEIEAKIKRLTDDELKDMAKEYELKDVNEKITLKECADAMRKQKINEFLV